jgi:glycosyltransferase involved in cell wall biosynthesis
MKRVLYFGIFNPDFSRNKIYIRGLRESGVEVLVCTDTAPGVRKYWNLFWKHWKLRDRYDVMVVGYPGYIVVPFARLITRKKVIFDALCSFYETEILSRDALHEVPFRKTYARLIDWCATRCADTVLVETKAQQRYFEEVLGVRAGKCVVVYTGVDDEVFKPDPMVKKFEQFTVLFRGRITHEAGVEYVLRAAKLLEGEGIDVLIIGYGWNTELERFNAVMEELKPVNVKHIAKQLPLTELVPLMQRCHVALGQFADHERLKRTIPHKAFEALALGLPYVTARAEGICEILEDGETCLLVRPADAEELARAIVQLKHTTDMQLSMKDKGARLFSSDFAPRVIVGPLLDVFA